MIHAVKRPEAHTATHLQRYLPNNMTRCIVARSKAPDAFWLEQAERLDWFKSPTAKRANGRFDPVGHHLVRGLARPTFAINAGRPAPCQARRPATALTFSSLTIRPSVKGRNLTLF